MDEVAAHLKTAFSQQQQAGKSTADGAAAEKRPTSKVRRTVVTRVFEAVKAIALCHNVTPVYEVGLLYHYLSSRVTLLADIRNIVFSASLQEKS